MVNHLNRQTACTTVTQLQLAEIYAQNSILWKPISTLTEPQVMLVTHLSTAITASVIEMVPVMSMSFGTISMLEMSLLMGLGLSTISILSKSSTSESILMKIPAAILQLTQSLFPKTASTSQCHQIIAHLVSP